MRSRAISFDCSGAPQVGIFHPSQGADASLGVVIVVGGGPQYRVGGHRQLVLWSRRLAADGYPVLRFDYRGMGDSHGAFPGFEDIDEDIHTAMDVMCTEAPSVRQIVLWGECDAAAAILFYAYRDPRVAGVVLLNPWARTESGQARTVLKHYYLDRLTQPSFWRKLFGLQFNPVVALRSALSLLAKSRPQPNPAAAIMPSASSLTTALPRSMPLPDKLLAGFSRFTGAVLLVISGRDLIAKEFDDLIRGSKEWGKALAGNRTTRRDIGQADHTFSSAEQRDQVIGHALSWLGMLRGR